MNDDGKEKQLKPTEQEIMEVLDDVPEKSKKIIEQMMISTIQMKSESPETITAHNITPEHITKFIDGANKEAEYFYKDKRQTRWFVLAVIAVLLVFTLVIINMLRDKPEIMEKVLYSIGGFVAGLAGGYGFGKTKKQD